MHRKIRTVATLLLALCLPLTAAGGTPLRAVTTPDVLADYQRFLAGRDPRAITRFDGDGARRDVAELVLLQQALARGGIQRPVDIVVAPTYARLLALVADGHAEITGNTVWKSDIDAQRGRLGASSALVADGEFVAGVFRAARATGVDARVKSGRWSTLSAVSSRHWTPDWQALQRLGLANLYDVADWPAMVRMVDAGRTDFLLAPFQPVPGGRLQLDGTVLVPVDGVCLPLAGSRHFAVTRADGGDALLGALDQGLASLRHDETLRRAYTESGFLTAASRSCRTPGH